MKVSPHLFTGDVVHSRRVIYQPSQFALQNLLYLQETGSLSAVKPHVSSRKDLASYLFIYVTAGAGTLVYNKRTYTLSAGDCAFIDCRLPYSQGSSRDNLWSLKWVHFDGNSMSGIYHKYLERGGQCVFRMTEEEALSELLDSLLEEASSSSYVRDMIINEKLSSLLTRLMVASWNPGAAVTQRSKSVDTSAIKSYIDEHFTDDICLDDLAERFNLNKFYLLRCFKDDFGTTITSYITQQRVLKAKSELRFTRNTLETIAQDCGFSDANYFIRAFRKVEGTTPGEYRKHW